jgi:diguanylate cyclase (GGDEF)-like protein
MDADQTSIMKRVALATGVSVAASVIITVAAYYFATGTLEHSALGITIAVIAPGLIAPIGSYYHISLSHRLRHANERLKVLSELDSLTSTLNRRTFMSVAGKHLSLASRHGYPTSLILLDFDHFKQVNDQHGHAMGDEVLMRTIDEIREAVRDTDVIARIGGEEFVLLLPHTAHEGAAYLAERILEKVRNLEVAHNAQSVSVTVTMGGATCPTSTCSLDELMSSADKLLYAAKQAGRDRCMLQAIDPHGSLKLSRAS